MSFAELTVMGNVGKAPEVRYSSEGKEFCHFSLAVNENTGKKDKEGHSIKETTWFNITCVGSLVNIAIQYIKKGNCVFVRGNLKARKYNTSNGQEISLDIFATKIYLLPNNRATEQDNSGSFDSETDNTDFNPEEYEQELVEPTTTSNSSKASNNKSLTAVTALKPK